MHSFSFLICLRSLATRRSARSRRAGACCAALALIAAVPLAAPAAAVDFARDIRPLLAERCLKCHGRDDPQAELNLVTFETATAPAASGQIAVVPGQPDQSELVRRIRTADPDQRMPPEGEKPLTPDEIDRLTNWIAEGAPWSQHWAFAPLADPAPPPIASPGWVRSPIDAFILAQLEQLGLTPSPEADRDRLIKRLSYDLLGLPPTPEEVDAFHADPAPDAYERLVDRLLASPHFGERWGRHWLDLAHYADSDGYEKDRPRPDAYLFRDWVIDAINRDLPFDQFTIAQLAGDLLPDATAEDRLATAFLRQTLTNEEGGVDQEEFRVNACFDRTDTVGTVWLGLTVGCAKCHSHKYDPLPHAEYYRLFAYFNDADEDLTEYPLAAADKAALLAQLAPLEAALAERHRELAPAQAAWEAAQRERVLATPDTPVAEHPLAIAEVEREDPADVTPVIEKGDVGDVVFLPPTTDVATPERQSLAITAQLAAPLRLTGLKLVALPDDRLPGKGPGRAENGNFVITSLQLRLVDPTAPARDIPLHRSAADYAQSRFSAADVLRQPPSPTAGWAVGGKLGQEHWLQVRTHEPLDLPAGAQLQIVIQQHYGQRHTLGRFRLVALTGDERGLNLREEKIVKALFMYPEKRVAQTRRELFDYYIRHELADEPCRQLEEQMAQVRRAHQARLTTVRTMARARLARPTHVFHRGDFLAPTEAVAAGTPSVLPPLSPRGSAADRLDLARWLVSPENPLTPRVVVNQVWQYLFGQALVTTPNDFGLRGQSPTHPALLDWLASRFRGDLGWSRKQLIRLIVTSAAYRQSSARRPELAQRDPANQWLARQGRFRVEAEIVRDLTLAASGLLSPKIGGPSVFPPMPEDLAKLSYANNFTWRDSTGDDRHRRGMYTFLKRTILHPNLTTFDAPDTNGACTVRTVSNTPLQALLLLNNPSHVEACHALAARLRQWSLASVASARCVADADPAKLTDDQLRLSHGLRLCVARPPRLAEIELLAQLLAQSRNVYTQQPQLAAQLVAKSAESSPSAESADSGTTTAEVAQIESAAWFVVARVLLNLDEFLTRE